MTKEQQHNIRNAIVCLRHAINTKNWSIVEVQVQRIDNVTKPRENDIIRAMLTELEKIRNEQDLCTIQKHVDDLIGLIKDIFYV